MLHSREEATGRVGSDYENNLRRIIFKSYLENETMRQRINFCKVTLDKLPIAYHFGFQFNQKLLWYKPTFDIAYSQFSVGKIIIKKSIEHAIAKKYSEFDFLLGDEIYKYQWTNSSRRVFEISMANLTYRSRVFYFLINSVRPRLKALKIFLINLLKRK
jgi:CelD/BcsL family acetyltransferase involved in cellulose biosynthesis